MRYLFTLCFLTLLCTCVSAQTEDLRLSTSLYFASADYEPNSTELEKLADFATTLSSYAAYTLRVEAFTDEKGTEAYNTALAERRAAAVTAALAHQNIVPATTEVLTYGEQRARQNTTDDAEREQDRRVDLVATVTRWESAEAAISKARADQLQSITINDPTVRQTISGAEGGTFLLEANALVRPDGSPAIGPVSVELIEAYDLSDMLIAGLTTTAAGKRLVTGGMISLTATDADGVSLELRKGRSITAATPTDDFNEQMRIFSGAKHDENGTPTDWALTTGGVASSADALFASLGPLPSLGSFRVTANANIGSLMARWREANPEPKAPVLEKVDHNFLSRKPVAPVLEEIVFEPKGLAGVFTSKAKIEEKTAEMRQKALETYQRHSERYERALVRNEGVPARNAARQEAYKQAHPDWQRRLEAHKESLMTTEVRRLMAQETARREKYMAARAARAEMLGEKLGELEDLSGQQSNISRYFFSINQLGWTNIDIFHVSGEESIQLLVEVPNSSPKATVVMIPTDRRSVIAYQPDTKAGTWKRSGIPRGLGYHVIAYQVMDGKLVMAHQYVEEASTVPAKMSYQPIAIDQLKDRIAGILGS
ncbi:OmpA family protein [Neolewinella agarilytica]|uniref:OmpA family protein n=1 Tax=Neolewinella agarilytica TaxID=478744 RepID=UPI002357EAC6|nr:OmpA family protein [Neolewinella agarilytica]